MTDSFNNNSQRSDNEYRELQEQYDFLSEQIQFLQNSERTDDLRPKEIFRLKKQIEQAKKERQEVDKELARKEQENISQALHDSLLRLGYHQQIELFRPLIQARSIPAFAFLIHGDEYYGQTWLSKRLVIQYVIDSVNAKVIKIGVARKVRRTGVKGIWDEVARRVGLQPTQHSPAEIAKQVCQWLQNQTVILVLHEVEKMLENTLCELIKDFWFPLICQVQEQPSQACQFKLLMFLIDNKGDVGDWKVPFQVPVVEQLNFNWNPQNPVKPPRINKFSDRDLSNWINTLSGQLSLKITAQKTNDVVIEEILQKSCSGIPEFALEEICDRCGCNWYEESQKWLKL